MSFLDRVTKAVGDVVDRGKKEVDHFMRIQKIHGQISDVEKKVGDFKGQIEQAKLKIGEMALEMLRAGTLTSSEMQSLLDQITGVEQQVAAAEAEIAEKKAEIERIKAEEKAERAPDAGPPPPSPPAAASAPVGRCCPHCGTPTAGSGAFCGQCGSKLA
jgi:predicted  nucleic acid-binding Zn-ribbon protein